MTGDLFPDPASPASVDVPWTLDKAITMFLWRWAFNWRGEHAVIERELRALIARAMDGTRRDCR